MTRPITAFTSGCFDGGLHAGHLHLLKHMSELADLVYVALNSSNYILRRKNRVALRTELERESDLYNSGLVDLVVHFDEDGPLKQILAFKPDFIVVGDDYTMEQVVGAEEAREWGGKLMILPRLPGFSTSAQIAAGTQHNPSL